jgi:hypothetical protein
MNPHGRDNASYRPTSRTETAICTQIPQTQAPDLKANRRTTPDNNCASAGFSRDLPLAEDIAPKAVAKWHGLTQNQVRPRHKHEPKDPAQAHLAQATQIKDVFVAVLLVDSARHIDISHLG